MLAGLLFAIHDAEDRPDRLTATLPFGGATLIEYQARQLIAAGASQIIVVVARLTPELMGALNRVSRRGVAVDPVRSAREAAGKLHPLARVVMLADGLVATQSTITALSGEGGDALLVTAGQDAPTSFERVGGGMAWAGVARLTPRRIAEVAAMPADYDPQSTLVRVTDAGGATHIALPDASLREGHGIDHAAHALEWRGRQVVAATVSARRGWFDRLIVAPVARAIVPPLVARSISGAAIAAAAVVFAGGGVAALAVDWLRLGVLLGVFGVLSFAIGAALGSLRDEPGTVAVHVWGLALLPALVALLLAWRVTLANGDDAAWVVAIALIANGALAERATRRSAPWWGSPPGYLIAAAVPTWLGLPFAGLVLAAIYATVTLATAIEALRRQP
jgi:hypothetical protein